MLYEYKSKIDKYFDANWSETPIQYDGIHFDMPTDGRWISIQLHPFYAIEETFGRAVTDERGLIKVFAYDKSATLTFELSNDVCLFLNEIFIDGAFVNTGVPDGRGAMPLRDGVFESLTNFTIENFTIL